jgi:hypothetical protein
MADGEHERRDREIIRAERDAAPTSSETCRHAGMPLLGSPPIVYYSVSA